MDNLGEHKMNFTIEKIIDLMETWLIKGDLTSAILADNFRFISPFWKSNSRAEFIDKFQNASDYKENVLSNSKLQSCISAK